MLEAFAALLLAQTVGEVLTYAFGLPVPGPVLGLLLMGGVLRFWPDAAAWLRPTSLELLRHLSLLFVPAGVGIMVHVARLGDEWLPIAVALIVSTALAIVVTAIVVAGSTRWLARRR